jgi:ubiquinone/menaquinone biosynthesis C-methylase UbiE
VSYDPDGLRAFFNSYAEMEWERLEASLQGRIKYSVHRHILDKYLKPGLEVLDVGCGPGRFALQEAA